MDPHPVNRLRDGRIPSAEHAKGSKRRVYLEMSSLINIALGHINGPKMDVRIVLCDRGRKKVSLSFDARKIPYPIRTGARDHNVSFIGGQFLRDDEVDLDAATRVADYLCSKFGIRFVDCSYEKYQIATKKFLDVQNSIMETVGNIKSMVGNWKACVSMLGETQVAFSASTNPFQLGLSGDLISVKCEVEAWIAHISDRINSVDAEHAHSLRVNNNNFPENVITIKISEKDILYDILVSLGFKNPKFTNTLQDNGMFTGNCKLDLNGTESTWKVGKTIIHGDAKNSAYEAECSAASKAIAYVERVLCIEIIDLNYYTLLDKMDSLDHLTSVSKKYVAIQHLVADEWLCMITKLKQVVNTSIDVFKGLGIDVDEKHRIESAEMIEEDLGEITFLYNMSTMDLDHSSS